jgi:hypothetical protein
MISARDRNLTASTSPPPIHQVQAQRATLASDGATELNPRAEGARLEMITRAR